MSRIIYLLTFLSLLVSASSYTKEIDYNNYEPILSAIKRETQAISVTHPADHDELAQLYVSRGESYLCSAQYDKAIDDFQNATSHMKYSQDVDAATIVAFRAAFGEVVCYDNLEMGVQTLQALDHLKLIASYIDCNDCIKHLTCQEILTASADQSYFSDMITICKHKKNKEKSQQPQQDNSDTYDDILGPNQPPESNWCEEVVTGVGRAMEAIACLAPNYAVKVALIGFIEALITRGLKCCQNGGFWKACVAPITRKWKEWQNHKEEHFLPNTQNLPLYFN